MKNKFNHGDRVSHYLSDDEVEIGVIVHYWFDEYLESYDYYVAFFGTSMPEGKPDEIPYVLKYLETSLQKLD